MKKAFVIIFLFVNINGFTQTHYLTPTHFLSICDVIFNEYNKNEGPDPIILSKNITIIEAYAKNKTVVAHDLYYSLYSFFNNMNNPNIALSIISSLTDNIVNKYHSFPPPLLDLFLGEMLIRCNEYKLALEIFQSTYDSYEKLYRQFPVIDFYIAFLNDKINNTDRFINQFKEKNSTFWLLSVYYR